MNDLKILLVDDEKDFIKSLSERLEMRDLKTSTVFNGEEALDAIKRINPNIILLDLKMPGMNGLEVLERVKKTYPRIQVIMLTGHGTEREGEMARKLGAFDYLQKPVKLDHLLRTLKKAHKKFLDSQYHVDTLLMGAAMAEAGESRVAREVMAERLHGEA